MMTKCPHCEYFNRVSREANLRALDNAIERDNYRSLVAEVINYLEPRVQYGSVTGAALLKKLSASLIRKENPDA